MTAKEMFEKLGYELVEYDQEFRIRYFHKSILSNSIIVFIICTKCCGFYEEDIDNGQRYIDYLPSELHLAIHQQMIELGWLK